MGQVFLADLHNYAPMVWRAMRKFGLITQAKEKRSMFLAGHPHHHLKGRAQRPKHLWPPTRACTQHEKQQPNSSWGSNYTCEKNITRSTKNADARSVCGS